MSAFFGGPCSEEDAFERFARRFFVVRAGEEALLAARVQAYIVEHARLFQHLQIADDALDDGKVVRRIDRARLRSGDAHLLVSQLAADERYLRLNRHERQRYAIPAIT